MNAHELAPVYVFAGFRLDVVQGVLFHRSKALQLTKKEVETLCVLVENSGRLVKRDEMMTRVWSDVCVEPANLTQNIFVLRKVLAQHEPGEHFIETVAKRGYRFLAQVRDVTERPRVQPPSGREEFQFKSLAVLPFANETGDPSAEYLSDGLTESIINSLSQVPDLRVVARTSVFQIKLRDVDPLLVGRDLGVSAVLSGRILKLGERVVIRAELVDAQKGWQIWGDQYDRTLSNILAVQQEIAESISAKLAVRLTGGGKGRLSKRFTESADAFQLYLKGRHHWEKFNQASEQRAIRYFLDAIAIDPTYALAYAGLADSYYRTANVYAPNRNAMPKAKAAALQALAIDETLAEGHAALGLIRLAHEWNWPEAEKELARALKINSNYAVAHQRAGLLFNLLGRFDEAREELIMAQNLDPLSPQVYWGFALNHFLRRQYQQAIEEIERALEMDGNYQPALYLLGRVHLELGEFTEAIDRFKKLIDLSDAPMFLAALGCAYALSGKRELAHRVLHDLDKQSDRRYVSAYHHATLHLALGDKNRAFSCLEEAYHSRCEMISWAKVDPALDRIRTELRFVNFLRRVRLD